jgi:hypothetical protein
MRLRRVVFVAGLFPFPLLGLLSSAIVVMTAVLRGPREAIVDCGLALALLGIVALVSGVADVPELLLVAAVTWAVWIGLGGIVWRTGSLTFALQAAVVLALIGLFVFDAAIGDPLKYWSETLQEVYASLGIETEGLEQVIALQAPLMSGVVVAGALTSGMLVLGWGNSLASRVVGEQHGRRFSELRLGYVIGGLAAVAGIGTLFGLGTQNALLVLGAGFAIHGIAVIAWWAGAKSWPSGWWIALCILPVLRLDFLVIEAALLAAVGFVDNWYGLRRAQKPG